MHALAELPTGLATHKFDNRGGGSHPETLGHGEIGQHEVVGASNSHRLRR